MLSEKLQAIQGIDTGSRLGDLKYSPIDPQGANPGFDPTVAGMAVAWDRYILIVASTPEGIQPAQQITIGGATITEENTVQDLLDAVSKPGA